jgi:IclR family transcriptional regulator, acetate operon repressor
MKALQVLKFKIPIDCYYLPMDHKMNTSHNNEHEQETYKLSTTVMKALQVLEYVGNNQPVHPAQIASALKLNRTSVHRHILTLIKTGYVLKAPEGFILTLKLIQLGRQTPLGKNLRNTVKPYMIELCSRINESVYLNVVIEDQVFAIDDVQSKQPFTLNKNLAFSDAIHVCASGKLFMAQMPLEERIAYIDSLHLTKFASNTITDKDVLLRATEEAGKNGYATEICEFSDEMLCLAAPIYDQDSNVIATISIPVPAGRVSEEQLLTYLPHLLDVSNEVSRIFGSNESINL